MELHPPVGMRMGEAAAALSQFLAVRLGPERGRARSYYDTFDGRLHAAGLELFHESGELVLTQRDSGPVRARAAMPRPRRPLLLAALAPGEMADALDGIVGVRALLIQARVHS